MEEAVFGEAIENCRGMIAGYQEMETKPGTKSF